VTVESNGVNAFFVDLQAFPKGFFDNITGAGFHENFAQRKRFRVGWEGQFEKIKSLKYVEIV